MTRECTTDTYKTWMNLKSIMLSKRSQTQRSTYCIILSFYLFILMFIFERETEHEPERGRERETQNPKQASGSKLTVVSPMWGSNSQTVRS